MATIEKRKGDDGIINYRVKVRLKGFPVQTATFSRQTDAKRYAQQTEAAIREGRHFKTSESKKRTLADLVDRYIKDVLPNKPKIAKGQETQLYWWKEKLGRLVLADITPAIIVEQRDKLASEDSKRDNQKISIKRSPATVNRYLAALSHAFTIAVNEWEWLENNPFRKVKKRKEPRGRVRFLSDAEKDNLLKACKESQNKLLYPVVVLALSTGARRSEILNLTWDDIDFNRGKIIIHETKNGERRSLPLIGHAAEVLKKHSKIRKINSEFVFPSYIPTKPIDIRSAWEKALESAGIEDFRFHDLRHSAASYLAMNGSSLAVIAETLGHKTLSMVKRYAHLTESHISSEVERMNNNIFGRKMNEI